MKKCNKCSVIIEPNLKEHGQIIINDGKAIQIPRDGEPEEIPCTW